MKQHPSWLVPREGDALPGGEDVGRRSTRIGGSVLKRLVSEGKSLVLILRAYLGIAWRFWRWRLDLWRHPEQLNFSILRRIDMQSGPDSSRPGGEYQKKPQRSSGFALGRADTRMKQTLLFIRHGQTTWNVEHLLPGQLPGVPLTEVGREQAERLAEALKILPITAIISSPLERACDTASYLARVRELPVLTEDDLKDTDVGPWAGKNYNELRKEDSAWKDYVRDPTRAPEGVESFPQVQQRVVAAVESWLKREETGNYPAFVAHADVIKLLLAHYMGLETARAGWLNIENASVSIVELEEEQRPRVVSVGWCPRPGWLTPPVAAPAESKEPPAQQFGDGASK
ncbi:MAG TPA: histidine phosphatase family protein [Ktedonobacteraceae bacterium]